MQGLAQAGVPQQCEFSLSRMLTGEARFPPLFVVPFPLRGRDLWGEGNLFRKSRRWCSLLQYMCKGKALPLSSGCRFPRRKLPGQGFLNFSLHGQSCFLPKQREFLTESDKYQPNLNCMKRNKHQKPPRAFPGSH